MQVKVDYDPTFATYEVLPRLVPISHDPNIQILQYTVDNGDGTNGLVGIVMNPNGFVDLDGGSWAPGNSTYDDLRFAIVVAEQGNFELDDYPWQDNYSLDAAESYFVDLDGDVIASLSPVLDRSY